MTAPAAGDELTGAATVAAPPGDTGDLPHAVTTAATAASTHMPRVMMRIFISGDT
jgi:hypothetical protein